MDKVLLLSICLCIALVGLYVILNTQQDSQVFGAKTQEEAASEYRIREIREDQWRKEAFETLRNSSNGRIRGFYQKLAATGDLPQSATEQELVEMIDNVSHPVWKRRLIDYYNHLYGQ